VDGTWVLAGCFGIALGISFFTSMAGVSGAFALVPVQISLFGITGPVVSATNHLYNLVATPGGILRYRKEGRMAWPIALLIGAGGIPGALLGAWMRIRFLPDGDVFRIFAGLVLLALGARLAIETVRLGSRSERPGPLETLSCTFRALTLAGRTQGFSWKTIGGLAFASGILGGAYGVGGGVFMAPVLVGVFSLPLHGVAGALLAGTFLTSAAGVGAFQLFSFADPAHHVAPDWWRGIAFGLGGLIGGYSGGHWQAYFSPRFIRGILAAVILVVAIRYLFV
jgi:uncharacterized membrane protein YfcA